MSYEIIIGLIAFIFIVITVALIPYLKSKGVWVIALFAVNVIEQVADFLWLEGAGVEKHAFVKRVLNMISPKLTDEEIDKIIKTLVEKMNALKGE